MFRRGGARRSAAPLVEAIADGGHKCVEIAEAIGKHVLDDREMDVGVAVHQDVAESGHIGDAVGEIAFDPATASEMVKKVPVRRGLTKAFVRDDVGCDVERGLDAELEGMLNEAFLANIRRDGSGRAISRSWRRQVSINANRRATSS